MLLAALLLAATQPADFRLSEDSDALAFSYGWPAVVAGDPVLERELRGRLEAAREQAESYLADDRGSRPADAPLNPHHYAAEWRVDGETAALLGLSATIETYTGGAHGNLQYAALLWDRASHAPIEAAGLLGAGLARIGPRYCAALDAERAGKRGGPTDPADMFGNCPQIEVQVLAPVDKDGNGRFDTLAVLLPPYAAGPYVEGDYVIEIGFEAGDLAAIPATYRAAFEPPGEPAGE